MLLVWITEAYFLTHIFIFYFRNTVKSQKALNDVTFDKKGDEVSDNVC